MTSNGSKPMTLLSMEAVLGQMKIEKLWELRRESDVIKWVSDGIPYEETRKWKCYSITIQGDRIVATEQRNAVLTTLNGTKQTRWASPMILSLRDSNSEVLQKSVLPVSSTFCREIKSLDIRSSQTEPEEYLQSICQLIDRCSGIIALTLHIPNINESQMFDVLRSFNLTQNVKEKLTMSVTSGTELTPNFIQQFYTTPGIDKLRIILVKQPEFGETEIPKRDTILHFFLNYKVFDTIKMTGRMMIFEKMDREIAHAIVGELDIMYENGNMFYENGALCFYLARPGQWAQLEIRNLATELVV